MNDTSDSDTDEEGLVYSFLNIVNRMQSLIEI